MSFLKELSVSELNNYIKNIFDAEEMLQNVKVIGELSGCQVVRGVAYFSLKDENALLSCVMFGVPSTGFSFKDGDSVCVVGSPKFYVKGGRLNFNVNKIELNGQGDLFKKFLELKNKLESEGYFALEHKKALPSNITRIGVVTSKGGAVLQDIINICTRRDKSVDIVLYNSKVQGVGAEKEIVNGINLFSDYDKVDVVVVARGGGSLEDLQPFNTLEVAQAVYNCKKPIVSAVGHETDFTICDFVADLRVPTPSAAAELLTKNKEVLKENFVKLARRFLFSISALINAKTSNLTLINTRQINSVEKLVEKYKNDIYSKTSMLMSLSKNFLNEKLYNLNHLNNSLQKLNPLAILNLGYAKIEKNGNSVVSVLDVDKNDDLQINLIDGQISTRVLGIKGDK